MLPIFKSKRMEKVNTTKEIKKLQQVEIRISVLKTQMQERGFFWFSSAN